MKTASLKQTIHLFFFLITIVLASRIGFAAQFLDPEQAFRLRAELGKDGNIGLHWDIANGYKLYRDRITAVVESGDATINEVVLPEGIDFVEPSTGEKMKIYHGQLSASVPLLKSSGPFRLRIEYQGCADGGLCYPPIGKVFEVNPDMPGELSLVESAGNASASAGLSAVKPVQPSKNEPTINESSLAKSTLEGGSLWRIAALFLLFGLLLSFTPCVLPMVPILSSIIVGKGEVSRAKSFLLALAYCLGMAMVYTLLGVAAGLAGEGLAGALQKPWVLIMFSLLLVGMSLSMFELYQLQLPTKLQNRLNEISGTLKGGHFIGVFFMGSISALIVGPCVAAPLAGTLVYISQTKNVLIGGLALFSMATGMSIPLILIGLSAGSLLPKAGPWMVGVKYVFGLLLIAVAIWMITPILPSPAALLAWGGLAILCSVFAGVFNALPEKSGMATKFIRAFGLLMLIIGVLEMIGAASGASNPLAPLSELHTSSGKVQGKSGKLPFRRISTNEELDRVLQSTDKPVMLDFYADWCVTCKEMEAYTFNDAMVREKLGGVTLLQVDVTADTKEDRELMKRFGLYGPPGIIFFDKTGREVAGSRIIGFADADAFLKALEAVL